MEINDNKDNTYSKIQIAYAESYEALSGVVLARGEQCFNEEEGKLYIGKGDGTNVFLASNEQITALTTLINSLQGELSALKIACPYEVDDYYMTASTVLPSIKWEGTTWTKIERRMLIGSSTNYPLNSTGGFENITLDITQMPVHRHQVANHTHTIPTHFHYIANNTSSKTTITSTSTLAYMRFDEHSRDYLACGSSEPATLGKTSDAGGGNTGGTSPYTDEQGNGAPINIMNPYLSVNIYRRVS